MSTHKARNSKKTNPALAQAQINNNAYALKQERDFQTEFAHMDVREMFAKANEFAIISTRIRALAWQKMNSATSNN